MKIHTRRLADKYKIPVIMITDNGDGVVLHVERYDLGYDKIFNQSWEYWNDLLEVIKSSRHKLGEIIVNEIIGGVDLVDNRVRNSVDKVMKKELVSWPQLGSAAILGGVIATIAIKKIVLNQDKQPYIWQRINPNDNW